MAITIPAPPDNLDLAIAKARIGAPLTVAHRRLLALHLAQRVHDYGDCLTGSERRMLADIATGPNVADRFELLVAAYADWRQVEDNVDDWRHQTDPAMSRDEASEYVNDHLADALAELIVVPTAVSA